MSTLWDESYPPSVLNPAPPVVPPTGVTAGTPGGFTPTGCAVPVNLSTLKADPVVGDNGTGKPGVGWTLGQYVILGDASEAYWDGTAWQAGRVPVVGGEVEATT